MPAVPAYTQTWCKSGYILGMLVFLTVTFLISVFSALRIFALWRRSRMWYVFPAVVFVLGTIPVGTNLFIWIRSSVEYTKTSQDVGCTSLANIPMKLNTEFVILTRCSAIASDIVVLVLTWVKSFVHWREMRRLGLTSSISGVLLRDGTFYFLALLGMSVLELLTYSTKFMYRSEGTYATIFLQFLPPLLVQRFILNLSRLSHTAEICGTSTSEQHPSLTPLSFRVSSDFLGNIGEPLNHSQSEQVEDSDDIHCAAEERQERIEAGSARFASPATIRREKLTSAGVAPVLLSLESASEESDVGSSAFLYGKAIGPFTAAD
ncbi:uncharacterized protein PHACADRAFT_246061 [Phanerochaete carnosa HHB-10118-sp]|uniref:Uncharacterized protein n=1 Tax=Phanerochaete carnosa (strain HHB-10118-sp) TaxID=650164 RepID=K5XB93_PHACS|nr:uncharacterized protein PHACADRAFT_246061 [Phanerochaete carnosa HHB-10118-sp]EKM60222.1 hypothetical protein PHACADRAFT_246061 [Phanerochaete carnosa HHB-10118-sp]